ncbi:hypothetical protein [Burkholderia glumae]
MKKILSALILCWSATSHADCVVGQQSATSVIVLSSNVLLLSGGYAGFTLVKSLTPIYRGANFAVVKDSFCDFDSNAIVMNNQPLTIQQVKNMH